MRRKRKPGQVKLQTQRGVGTRILYEEKGRKKTYLLREINEEIER